MARPMRPNIPPMPEEQKKEAMVRAAMQKKASIAEGILFNMVQGTAISLSMDSDSRDHHRELVLIADMMATEFMKVVYGQEIVFKEEE